MPCDFHIQKSHASVPPCTHTHVHAYSNNKMAAADEVAEQMADIVNKLISDGKPTMAHYDSK
eukprot:COSAG04_NODE_104_length_26097_cov_12.466074_21_plen_62_part_00